MARVPANDPGIDLHQMFSQRGRATFKTLYLDPYTREFDISSGFEDRSMTMCKSFGSDIVRRLKKTEYQNALDNGSVDGLIIDTIDEVLAITDSIALIDTLGFFKLIKTPNFSFKMDTIYNVESKHPLCLLIVPNYEDLGYDFDSKMVITDINPDSHLKACRFAENTIYKISGQDKIMSLQFLIVFVLEIIFADEQLEIEQLAFTIVPSKTMEFYLHGPFQLPLYKEVILEKDMQFIKDINFWEISIMCQRRYLKGEMKKTEGSLIVNIGPEELLAIYDQDEDTMMCNSMFIGEGILPESAIYTGDNLEEVKSSSGLVKSVMPDDYSAQEVKDVIESYISNVLVRPSSLQQEPSEPGDITPKNKGEKSGGEAKEVKKS